MVWVKYALSAVALAVLSACGGGGGSAGNTGAGAGGGAAVVAAPTLTLSLVNKDGAALSTPSLSQTEPRYLKVVVKNANGVLQAYKRVDVKLDSALAVLTPQSGSQLTDANGVALLAVAPASVSSSGAVTVTAEVSFDGTKVSKTMDLQITSGSVALSGLQVTPATVQKGQSVNVSVNALINGVAAASNSVSVVFNSSCGTVSPASALVDNSGKASAVIQTTSAGSCSVSATATGVSSPLTSTYTVTTAPITGIQFVQTLPAVIYQKDSPGPKTALVTFKVVDSNGTPVQGQNVVATLVGNDSGVNFCNASTTGVSSADKGEVTFSVCGGTQPDTVQVRATLVGTSTYTDSNILTVQTGLPTQRFFDLSASQSNFYAGGLFTSQFNGNKVKISAFAADRQGNPVPDGTPVVFVTEGGQINSSNVSSCLVNNGSCTVDLIGQNYRPLGSNVSGADPRPGRVTVLAMADGEESFIDADNDNRYDPDELFEDLGKPFMDKNEDGKFTASYLNLVQGTNEGEALYVVPNDAAGDKACPINSDSGLSQEGSCNKKWNGSGIDLKTGEYYTPTKVRRSIVVVFSGGELGYPAAQKAGTCTHTVADPAKIYDASIPSKYHTELLSCGINGLTIRLADWDGNPLPADAKLSAVVRQPEGGKCAASVGEVIGNSTEPTVHTVLLDKCLGGGVETVDIKVTVSAVGTGSKTSSFSVVLP